MQIHPMNTIHFGNNAQLSKNVIKIIEKQTKVSFNEHLSHSSDEIRDLMIKRGAIKSDGKLKQLFAKIYQKFGEKAGLIKKQPNIYTDID